MRIEGKSIFQMVIRPAIAADFEAIAAVQTESWQDTYRNNLPEEYLCGPIVDDLKDHWSKLTIETKDVVLVADDNGVVGFIAIWCRPDPYIDNLHVKPSHRSMGLGALLMKSAARKLIQQGHKTAYLWVVESNERAIRFYTRLGGIPTDKALKDLFGHDVPNIRIEWSNLENMCTGSV